MANSPNHQQPLQVKFFFNETELDLIKQKIAPAEVSNMGAFLRKMAIDGYIVRLRFDELKKPIASMRRIPDEENRIVRRNGTGRVYGADTEELKSIQQEILAGINKFPMTLASSPKLLFYGHLPSAGISLFPGEIRRFPRGIHGSHPGK